MAVLIKLPALLQQQAEQQRVGLAGVQADEMGALALSNFMCEAFTHHQNWWRQLREQPPVADEWQHYTVWLQHELGSDPRADENALMHSLRLFRRHMLARIAWMQSLQLADCGQTLRQLSELAETLIVTARDVLYQLCCRDWGTPVNARGEAQPLLILAMGKLGGGELNFSSDIDLIFTYPDGGSTQGGRRELDNAQFFTRLSQRLIKVLDQITVEGFVYRVDMRLRPFGDSGPLVLSFFALEDYYQEQGRDWERYAMIKARLLGHDGDRYSQSLYAMLRPFIYRRYIDFSVIQSLRNMKSMIANEVRRRGLQDNIKLGAGGIREIEFIIQTFQLIRGGRECSLQQRALLPALQAISELSLLPVEITDRLKEAYLFLRRLENLLQAIHDEQTQTLPVDELNQARLAWGMGYIDWPELLIQLEERMQAVRHIFNSFVSNEENEENTDKGVEASALWQERLTNAELEGYFPHIAESERQQLLKTLYDFRHDIDKRTIGVRGREVLDQLMPQLLSQICCRDDAILLLQRLTPLLLNIVTRTPYLELLTEYPATLDHLIRLCAASPMIANQLACYPLLLDELLVPNTLYCPIAQETYQDELRQYLMRVPTDDEEQYLEALRQFKQAQLLRIAAGDITGVLPVMKVSDHLTYLAEAMINAVVQQAWQQMVARYGQPAHLSASDERGFAVLGYGKLGGWELGYGSDLDLVFLLSCPDNVVTDGKCSIDGRQFYLRLAQRIIHLFSVRTASGILYDVDARLRPSGASGILVSTIESFANYQRNEAWTWEHQALVRVRPVYGDAVLHRQFTDIRQEILCQPRYRTKLQQEVREMREKMYSHLASKQRDQFNIKTDPGGITDIEFIAQYLVLAYAHQTPALTRWSDNVRIFALMAQHNIMLPAEAEVLTQAYVTMRNMTHQLALQERPAVVDNSMFVHERKQVHNSWQRWLG